MPSLILIGFGGKVLCNRYVFVNPIHRESANSLINSLFITVTVRRFNMNSIEIKYFLGHTGPGNYIYLKVTIICG